MHKFFQLNLISCTSIMSSFVLGSISLIIYCWAADACSLGDNIFNSTCLLLV